jgi:prolyl-tRNA synthetase
MMGDKRALQSGTSHNLGQNFAKAFNIQFLDENNQLQYAWTTSWGLSTRIIGAIIMTHGDDQGLVMPPRLAPFQAVIVPIWKTPEEKQTVLEAANNLKQILAATNIRVQLDASEQKTPGWKYNYWELKGVPIRVELGPRDIAQGTAVLARRDILGREGKINGTALDQIPERVKNLLVEIQAAMLKRATEFRDANINDVKSYADLETIIEQGGWARGWWAGTDEDELKIKEQLGITIRCFPSEQSTGPGVCFYTGKPARDIALFAKAY